MALRAESHDAAQQRLLDESLRRITARAQAREGVHRQQSTELQADEKMARKDEPGKIDE